MSFDFQSQQKTLDAPALAERIRPHQTTPILHTNSILLFLFGTVQRREIKVRRRIVLGPVAEISLKERVGDDGSKGKDEGRISSGVRLTLMVVGNEHRSERAEI